MTKFTTRDIAFIAMIAAIYTALCLALAPISFGMVQIRVAEALTLLAIFSPIGIWGITLGCALSNLVGFFTGANILGYMDIIFGTAATLIAAVLSWTFRNVRTFGVPLLSAVPPVVINALVIGAELAVLMNGEDSFAALFAVNAAYVAAGQFLACFALGIPLALALERTGAAKVCFGTTL